jgi:hypothetical protein
MSDESIAGRIERLEAEEHELRTLEQTDNRHDRSRCTQRCGNASDCLGADALRTPCETGVLRVPRRPTG